MIRRKPKGEGTTDYINNIMGTIYFLIKGESPPKVIVEMRILMHLTDEVASGDWYLFEIYTMISNKREGQPKLVSSLDYSTGQLLTSVMELKKLGEKSVKNYKVTQMVDQL